MPDYVIAVRNLKKGQFGSEPGPTRFLSVPGNQLPKPSHKITRNEWVKKVMKEAEVGVDSVTGRPRGDILIFIHGYNNNAEAIMWRHRRLKKDLSAKGYKGTVVSFDWPSNDVGINYLEDRSDARKTAIRLVDDGIRLFAVTQASGCDMNVHLLAHSTGAYVIREAFDDADDRRGIASVNWSVSQIAFIGADVSSASMSASDSKSRSIYRHCVRLTNYQNPYDSVLKLSNIKRVGVAPRVGRIGLPGEAPQKAVNLNCGPFFSKLKEGKKGATHIGAWDHSWHIGNSRFAQDLVYTLEGNIDRNYIPTRKTIDGELSLF
jgi:esterase/lipase superfamily enzyme